MDYIKLLIESFKLNKKTWSITAAYDLVLILASYILLFIWSLWMNSLISKTNLDITELTEEIIADVASLKNFYYGTLISFLVLFLLVFVVWSFFKGIIWCVISDKHFNLSYFKKFLLLNLACIPLYIVVFAVFLIAAIIFNYLFLLISTSMQNSSLAVVFISVLFLIVFAPLVIYIAILPSLVYYYFTKKNSIRESFNKMFNTAIKKIHLFYVPCLIITVVFVLLSIITTPLGLLPETTIFLIFLVILVFYVSWARIYIVSFAESLNKKHHKI
ncbi:MAG: hypothetical protein PHV16_00475 [Candidatus Nanoarchaeia archaeon]|nr:hypothetical protein [Candidatus Nanoarchaeia archaeon]